MKAVNVIIKIVAALAAAAGIVYVIATYGDKIVAWAKGLLGCAGCDADCESCECECDDYVEELIEEAVEEAAEEAEEAVEVPAAEEATEDAVVASDADFEG